MQCKAALCIIGVFHTCPTDDVGALAGLISIHLHLKKLATLLSIHLIQSLLRGAHLKEASPHWLSLEIMSDSV